MNQIAQADVSLPALMFTQAIDQAGEVYQGQPETYGHLGIYGGHFLGQALNAGFNSVAETRRAQSLHSYFLSPGNPLLPIDYHVTRLRESKYSDTRSITAIQEGRPRFHMIANYKDPDPTPWDAHQKTMPAVISPEVLKEKLAESKQFKPPMLAKDRAEIMLISQPFVSDKFTPGREAVLQNWMRSSHTESVDAAMSQCVLAFLSDGTLMFNAALPHGLPFVDRRLTSLDHSIWFHHQSDCSEWHLFDQRSTAAADGRGLNEGEFFDQDGKMILTVSQESMLRRM